MSPMLKQGGERVIARESLFTIDDINLFLIEAPTYRATLSLRVLSCYLRSLPRVT